MRNFRDLRLPHPEPREHSGHPGFLRVRQGVEGALERLVVLRRERGQELSGDLRERLVRCGEVYSSCSRYVYPDSPCSYILSSSRLSSKVMRLARSAASVAWRTLAMRSRRS